MTDTINVGELIRFSGKIAEANEVKCAKELMLHQLCLFKNFSEMLKGSKNCDELFQIGFNIQPGCDGGGDIVSEFDILVISVKNLSAFYFDHKYWSIVLQFSHGKVCVWNLKSPFKPGDLENFSTQFYPTFDVESTGDNVDIHLTFAMQLSGINYTKSFPITSLHMDILYFLNPGRRPHSPYSLQQSILNLQPTLPDSDSESSGKKLPSVCRFNIKTDEKLQKVFIREIFLKDVNFSRGFSMCGDNETDIILREPSEYYAYFYEDRIIFSKQDDNTISFRCSSPSVLFLLKNAIYRRLLTLCENRTVKIKSSDSKQCDSLYEVKLRLESLGKSTSSIADFMGLYYEFRDASESILCFCYNI